ncbi:MAG: TIGR04063 family PEP-CTERM/XrtA system glycosyltransferase [Burkholderiales bacterium]
MRILHILDHSLPLHSGYTFRTLSILRAQRALGWETFHLTSEKQTGCTVQQENVDSWDFYRTAPATGLPSRLPVFNQLALMRGLEQRLDEVVREVRPDILHAHSPVLNALPAIRIGKRYNIPVVYEVRAFWEDAAVDHGTTAEGSLRYRMTRLLETWAFKRADAVTTICEGLRRDIVARGIASDKVTVIPNAVDIAGFQSGGVADMQLKTQLGLNGGRVLGFVGSFYAYEGLGLLLESLPEILARAPDVFVLLVGGGPQEALLKQMAQQLGISGRVIFTGRVPHQTVQDYYNLIDILIYPRLSMRLTELVTPLKPLEAMAQGKLLIASDVGGHHELIEDGRTGVLFKAGNARDLAEKTLALLGDSNSWQAYRNAGRQFVEQTRNWTASVGRYSAIYQALLNGRSHA